MQKSYLIFLFTAFILSINISKAQTYTLTRGLPLAEISGAGTAITGLGDDNSVGPFNIGFSFTFIGSSYTQFYLGSNGIITFGSGSSSSSISIPSNFGKDIIAFACTDQVPNLGTPTINYFTSGTAPNRILVLNYKNVQRYQASANITTVQIQLYENNGKIEIHSTLNASNGSTRTIGIQNANGTESYTSTTLNNTNTLSANNEMIRFSLPSPCTHNVSISSTATSLCDGQSAITISSSITPAGAYTYQWLKNNSVIAGTTFANYSATTPGIYKLIVTNSSNCQSFSNTINIIQPFTVTPSSSSNYTCNNITAYINPTGTYTYQWFKSNTALSGATTNSLIPSISGYYKVKATSGSCTITSDSVNVLLNTLNATGGTGYTCASTNLNAYLTSIPSGTTFSWTGPNSYTSTSQYATINNLSSTNQGVYTVKATSLGCATFVATANVIVQNNILTASGNPGYTCASANLNASLSSTPSGTTFSWTGPNSYTSTSQYPTITNLSSTNQGVYTVKATSLGCATFIATTNLTVQNNILTATAGTGYTCGNTYLYSSLSSTPSGTTFSWTGPNGFTSTSSFATINNISFNKQGVYTVKATSLGCATLIATANLTVQNNILTATAGTGYICGTTNLSANLSSTPSGTTFSWIGPNSYTSTSQYPTINNLSINNQGTYTITAIAPSCNAFVTTTSLTILPNTGTISFSGNTYECGTTTLAFNTPYGTISPTAYLWTGPNGFSSTLNSPQIPIQSLANSGIYTIQATFSTCGVVTATATRTINPNYVSISGDISASLCPGQNVQLGTFTGNNAHVTYSWAGPSGFTSTSINPNFILTPANIGVYTVIANFTGCKTTSATTLITTGNITVSAGISNSLVCPSNTVTLASNINGSSTYNNPPSPTAVSYQWSGPNGFSSTDRNPTLSNVIPINSGFYTLNAVISGGCVGTNTSIVSLNVRDNPEMQVYGNGAFCSGESTTIQASPNNYLGNTNVLYQWTGPDGFSSTLRNPTITSVGSGGVYTISATFSGGCSGTYTNLVHIFSRRKPSLTASNNAVCLGNTIYLNSYSDYTPRNSFFWQGPDNFNSTVQSPQIMNATNAKLGVYTVTLSQTSCPETSSATASVSLSNNCSTATSCYAGILQISSAPCPGGGVTLLTGNPNGGNYYNAGTGYSSLTFSWSGPNGFTATGNRADISNITATGTYIQTMNVVGGTCNGVYTAQKIVTVKPAMNTPVFSGAISKTVGCEGDNFYFSNSVNGGNVKQYIINGPNGFIYYGRYSSSDNFYSNNPLQSGTYTINGVMNGECQSSTTDFAFNRTYNLTISPRPQAPTISNTIFGQTVTLTGAGCSNQINWSVGNIIGSTFNYITSNPFNDTPPANSNTIYWAICKSIDGCLSPSSNRLLVSLNCTTMQSTQSGSWSNPNIWSCGRIPMSSDITTISVGHIINIPASTSAFVRNLLNYGTLSYEQNASLRVGQ